MAAGADNGLLGFGTGESGPLVVSSDTVSAEEDDSDSGAWAGAGVYYLALHAVYRGQGEPPRAEIPFTFDAQVQGVAQPNASPTATPTPTASPTATPTAAPVSSEGSAGPSAAVAAVGGVIGILIGVIAGIGAVGVLTEGSNASKDQREPPRPAVHWRCRCRSPTASKRT